MERKIGEKFYDGNNLIEVVLGEGCRDCHYVGKGCSSNNAPRYKIAGDCAVCFRTDRHSVKFIKIGENKMDKKEELLKRISEMEQREKDNQKTLEEMRKKVEELDKKDVEVSATGVYLKEINGKRYLSINVERDYKIFTAGFTNHKFDTVRLNDNNCFATEKQAEQEALRREIQEFIRRCAMLWNENHDWRKKMSRLQYCIYINDGDNLQTSADRDFSKGQANFDTKELAEKCIAELNKKYTTEQLKIGFGVI